jgi:hypothetical protein
MDYSVYTFYLSTVLVRTLSQCIRALTFNQKPVVDGMTLRYNKRSWSLDADLQSVDRRRLRGLNQVIHPVPIPVKL